jgi:hypothetical protein
MIQTAPLKQKSILLKGFGSLPGWSWLAAQDFHSSLRVYSCHFCDKRVISLPQRGCIRQVGERFSAVEQEQRGEPLALGFQQRRRMTCGQPCFVEHSICGLSRYLMQASLSQLTPSFVSLTLVFVALISGQIGGQGPYTPGWQIGHEWMGMVEAVGPDVRTIKRGNRVIAPYDFADGTCEFCRKGLDSACVQGGLWGFGHEGGQAEAIRARFADATLVVVPPSVEGDEALLKAILPVTDVMAAGHHAAVMAGMHRGDTAIVIGD